MIGTRERFTLSLYLAVVLASAMLWGAEGVFSPAALTIVVATAAFSYVEHRGFHLSVAVANGLGLAAIVAALVELWLRDVEGRILFGAHLLVYLTWILLWLPKDSRQRWGLLALAVLQVAVGSVLTSSGLYGLGMAALLVLMVWTLVLLQLDEAEVRHAPGVVPLPAEAAGRPAALLLGRGGVAPTGQAAFGRWPFRQLAAAVAVTVFGALAVGVCFFMLVPRIEVARRGFEDGDSPLARQRITGFTDTVRLGAFGEILESSVPVFELRLFDAADDAPLDVDAYSRSLGYDEPLFRGMALTRYVRGEWASSPEGDYVPLMFPRALSRRSFVRQEYRIQPSSSPALFGIAPYSGAYIPGGDEPILWRQSALTMVRPRSRRFRGELNYVLLSPRSVSDATRPDRPPAWSFWDAFRPDGPSPQAYFENLALPDGLDDLRRVSTRVARLGNADAPSEAKADRLVAYLRDSGEFRYTLSGEIIDPRRDPVEDFLVNRRAGHCEYFASALALMLRAEGIPSRLVTGFKGGEINRLSGAFEVQQRHAHTWVEADLGGKWVTLDPTPSAERNQSVAANAPAVPLWSDLRTAAAAFWRQYIVQMNLTQQQRTLAPLRDAAIAAANSAKKEWWPALTARVYAFVTDPSRWFSWQGGVVTFVVLLTGVGTWQVGKRAAVRCRRWKARRDSRRRRGRRVEFYERFRRVCARRGLVPGTGQTPREFAAVVTGRLSDSALPTRVAALPSELTEEFYGIRFGELDPPAGREDELEGRLTEFEAALATESSRTGNHGL